MICTLFIVICTVITVDALKCYIGGSADNEGAKTEADCTGGSCLKVTASSSGRLFYTAFHQFRPWARYGPRAPPQLYQTRLFLKHWVPLNMKSSGNTKNVGPHYPFGSNVGPYPQNAKFSNVLLRHRISEVRMNVVICISLGLLYIFVVFGATVCKTVRPMLSDCCLSVCLSCLSVCDVGALWPNG